MVKERIAVRNSVRTSPANDSDSHRRVSRVALHSQSGLVDFESLPSKMVGIRLSNNSGTSGRVDLTHSDLERVLTKDLKPRGRKKR